MKNIISILLLVASFSLFSQNDNRFEPTNDKSGNLRFASQVVGGLNVGASMPIPISNRMSDFSWVPPFSPYLGYKLTAYSNSNFGITSGLIFEAKGMKVQASVYQLYTEVIVDGIETKGYFTGRNKTEVDNFYMTFPLEFSYLKPKYRVNLGMHFSYVLSHEFDGEVSDGYLRKDTPVGDRILVTSSPYNFDDEVRKFDMAVSLSYERKIWNNLNLNCGLNWSLTPLMNSSFTGLPYKMYNVYANIGVSYYFK